MMNFYDFLIFIRQTKIPASRLFLLNALCHEPIVKIASSGLLIQFSDIEPCMFDRIYLHFESDYPFGDFGSIPIH